MGTAQRWDFSRWVRTMGTLGGNCQAVPITRPFPIAKEKGEKALPPTAPPPGGLARESQGFPGGGEIQKVFTTQGLTSTLEKAIISCVVCEPLYD